MMRLVLHYSPTPSPTFEEPEEIKPWATLIDPLNIIFSYLPLTTLLSCQRTCRRWKTRVEGDVNLKYLFRRTVYRNMQELNFEPHHNELPAPLFLRGKMQIINENVCLIVNSEQGQSTLSSCHLGNHRTSSKTISDTQYNLMDIYHKSLYVLDELSGYIDCYNLDTMQRSNRYKSKIAYLNDEGEFNIDGLIATPNQIISFTNPLVIHTSLFEVINLKNQHTQTLGYPSKCSHLRVHGPWIVFGFRDGNVQITIEKIEQEEAVLTKLYEHDFPGFQLLKSFYQNGYLFLCFDHVCLSKTLMVVMEATSGKIVQRFSDKGIPTVLFLYESMLVCIAAKVKDDMKTTIQFIHFDKGTLIQSIDLEHKCDHAFLKEGILHCYHISELTNMIHHTTIDFTSVHPRPPVLITRTVSPCPGKKRV